MKALVCPQCAASITLDSTREFGFCSYCGAKIQINETIIHEHRGEISLDGVASVRTLCKKGFMEIDADDFIAASNTFDKAAEIDCDDIYVIIGKMLTKNQKLDRGKFSHIEYTVFDEFYYELLKKHRDLISEEETKVINEKNCKVFLKCYCLFGDKSRTEFVLNKFPQAADIDLINYKHFNEPSVRDELKYGIEDSYCHCISKLLSDKNPVDVIAYILNSGCSPEDVFYVLYYNAYCKTNEDKSGNDNFYIDVLPINLLKKLINAGLNPSLEVPISKHYYDDGYNLSCLKKHKFYELNRHVTLFSDSNDSDKISEYSAFLDNLREEQEKNQPNEKSKGCYIATYVYGSYDCPQVWTLRRFRDSVLAKTWYGRMFILLYYTFSPRLIEIFKDTEWFKKLWIHPLNKIVKKLNQKGFSNTRYEDT